MREDRLTNVIVLRATSATPPLFQLPGEGGTDGTWATLAAITEGIRVRLIPGATLPCYIPQRRL